MFRYTYEYIHIHYALCTRYICGGMNYFGCNYIGIPVRLCLLATRQTALPVYLCAMNEYDVNFVSSLEDTVSIEISTESKFWFLTHFVTSICCLCVNGEVGVFSECSCRTNRVFTLHCIPLLVVEGNNKSSYSESS